MGTEEHVNSFRSVPSNLLNDETQTQAYYPVCTLSVAKKIKVLSLNIDVQAHFQAPCRVLYSWSVDMLCGRNSFSLLPSCPSRVHDSERIIVCLMEQEGNKTRDIAGNWKQWGGGIVHRMLLNSSNWPDSAQLHRKHVHHLLVPDDFLKSRSQLTLYTVKRLKCEDKSLFFWVFSCLLTCFLRHASSML